MNEKIKILIVDDDKRIVKMIAEYMKLYNFCPISAYSGTDALAYIDDTFSLVILDINLDDTDGVTICEKIRSRYDIPIIMVSANSTSFDKINALGAGADDYIVKPFDPLELVARVKSHIRRANRYKAINTPSDIIRFDNITIHKNAYKVLKNNEEINFSNTEFRLLIYFIDNNGIALDRKKILNDVWRSELYDESIINTYVKRIREKLCSDTEKYIKSVRSIGYVFEADITKIN